MISILADLQGWKTSFFKCYLVFWLRILFSNSQSFRAAEDSVLKAEAVRGGFGGGVVYFCDDSQP